MSAVRPSNTLVSGLPALFDPTEAEHLAQLAHVYALESVSHEPIHRDDETGGDLASTYLPRGRIDRRGLPREVEAVVGRRLKDRWSWFDSWIPDFAGFSPWIVVGYEPGQYVAPHADGPDFLDDASMSQAAVVIVSLRRPQEGGELVVSATMDPTYWTPGLGARRGLDCTAGDACFPVCAIDLVVNLAPGDALVVGSEIVHSTRPVIRGTAVKVLCFALVAATSRSER